MKTDIKELSQRLKYIETEIEISQRRRKEEAEKAVKALSKISAEDIEMLDCIVPMLKFVVKYSEDDILKNANGEINNIQRVTDELRNYLEDRLTYYENLL